MNISYDSTVDETSSDSKRAENLILQQRSGVSRTKRALEDLNLIDAFMFGASTEKIQDAELIARIIIERATGQKPDRVIVQSEKSIRGINPDYHGIRLDLFITEYNNEKVVKVYDIEPNNYDLKKLPRRERYNQALTDVKMLETGMDFLSLPDYISIWILPDDPFGAGRMIYTVKNMVAENEKIVYNDGVKRMFLNAKGTVGGNDKLGALLNYFCDSCEKNATDPELMELHNIVDGVKENKKVGEQYMSYMTWQELARCEARRDITEEVKEEVTKEVTEAVTKEVTEAVTKEVTEADIQVLVRSCAKLGATNDEIVDILMKEYALSEKQAKEKVMNR